MNSNHRPRVCYTPIYRIVYAHVAYIVVWGNYSHNIYVSHTSPNTALMEDLSGELLPSVLRSAN